MDRLQRGNSIIEYAQPPDGFDAITASDDELAKYGFTPRPKDPVARAHWERRSRLKRVPPQFVDFTPARVRPTAPLVANAAGVIASPTWSGSLLRPPAGVGVSGVWGYMVPPISVGGYTNGRFGALMFVGIGGFPTTPLFQAGIYFEVDVANGTPSAPKYYFWYEWFPVTPGQLTTNPPIQAGAVCEVTVTLSSPVSGTIDFANLSTGLSSQYTVTVPDLPQNHVATDSAEWIFERLDPNLYLYPEFGPMFYADRALPGAWFTNNQSKSINSGTLIEMWSDGNQLAQVQSLGSQTGDALMILATPSRS